MSDDEPNIPEVPADLSHVQTDELIEELLKRYDHAAFTGMKVMTHIASEYKQRFVGNCHLLVGLLQDLSITVLDLHRAECMGGTLEDLEDDD